MVYKQARDLFYANRWLLELLHSSKNANKLLSFTDTENNQFIPHNLRWFAMLRMASMLSISLHMGHFAHVAEPTEVGFCVSTFPLSHYLAHLLHPENCAHPTIAIKHINTKHFIVWPTGNIQNHCFFAALHILYLHIFTSFNFGSAQNSSFTYDFFPTSSSSSSSVSSSSPRFLICCMFVWPQ